ncbi:chloramphenicol acetyltransferase [Magnetospira thiophila]
MKQLSIEPTIDPSASVRDCRLGAWTEVGARTQIAETAMDDYSYVVNDSDIIYAHIGKFVNIASHVRINPGQHPLSRASLHHFQYRSAAYDLGEDDAAFFDWRRSSPVIIGHDCWIGHGAIVMGGVTIGTGAVIGSGAVVTHDVPNFGIVVGVPAAPLKERFPKPLQEALLRIAWWDWSHAQIKDRMDDFRTLSTEAFCEKYDPAV